MKWTEIPQDWRYDDDASRLNSEIKAHMGRLDFRQDKIATIIGVPRQAVSQRLKGRTHWRWSELQKLAEVWGISAEELAGGSPENHTDVTRE